MEQRKPDYGRSGRDRTQFLTGRSGDSLVMAERAQTGIRLIRNSLQKCALESVKVWNLHVEAIYVTLCFDFCSILMASCHSRTFNITFQKQREGPFWMKSLFAKRLQLARECAPEILFRRINLTSQSWRLGANEATPCLSQPAPLTTAHNPMLPRSKQNPLLLRSTVGVTRGYSR
jgi:hypothetical protein